jgi:hypothetical protein
MRWRPRSTIPFELVQLAVGLGERLVEAAALLGRE